MIHIVIDYFQAYYWYTKPLRIIMKNIFTLMILVLFVQTCGYGQNSYEYSQPQQLEDGWKTNNLKSQNVDTTLIYTLFTQLKNKENKVHSVLLVKNGQLIIEEYFKGHSVQKPHDLRSTTKSVRAILMGIAIDKGLSLIHI